MKTNAERQREHRGNLVRYVTAIHRMMLELKDEMALLRNEMANRYVTAAPPNKKNPDPKELTPPISPLSNLRLTSPKGGANTDFDRWWDGYPDKTAKARARKAFAKALTKTSLDQLIAGVERYKATKPPDRDWCHPATWLNDERWLDVPSKAPPATNGHSPEINEFRAKQLAELARKGIHVLPGSMT